MTTGLFSESGSARLSSAIASSCWPASLSAMPRPRCAETEFASRLERLAELRDRVGVLAGEEQIPAEVAVDDRRQRIEIQRASHLGDRV